MAKLDTYLKGNTPESMMRLATMVIIISGAMVALAVVFAIVWYAIHQIPLPGTEVAAALGGDAAYTGAGVAGKAWQKNIEMKGRTQNYTVPETLKDFQG
jgi:hypothetical protein